MRLGVKKRIIESYHKLESSATTSVYQSVSIIGTLCNNVSTRADFIPADLFSLQDPTKLRLFEFEKQTVGLDSEVAP